MAAHYSPRKSSGPVLRSLSPSGRFSHQYSLRSLHGQSSHTTSSFASTTSSTFTNTRSFQRPTSPTRVNMYNYTNRSVRFTLDRPTSPNRSISVSSREKTRVAPVRRGHVCARPPTIPVRSVTAYIKDSGTKIPFNLMLQFVGMRRIKFSGQLIKHGALWSKLISCGFLEVMAMDAIRQQGQ
ncbi:uncharacterized protein Fot_51884 [Forsythia ovata]|uniref:Uncharacterized protein n=1 Tax=Forsythia ovata TaxID=205694 RepID=A0ABD1PXJ9_9LAMI